MPRKKTKNHTIRYFLLFSFVLHTISFLAAGRWVHLRASDLLFEVDLRAMPLKEDNQTTRQAQPPRDIPKPYLRPKPLSQARNMKVADRSPAPINPAFSQTSPAPLIDSEKALNSGAVEKLSVPLSNSKDRSDGGLYVPWSGSSGRSGGSAVVGQIAPGSLPRIPLQAKVAYEHLDQTLAYQRMIHRHIDEHKKFPPLAVRMGWEGNVDVQFLLHRDGRVEQIQVIRSSRIDLLDNAALAAVKDGNPFPPFPGSMPEDSILIEVTLNFSLRGAGIR
ncbi:MAG: energy transducer TonB [bacterium]